MARPRTTPKAPTSTAPYHVALLRGVNVGGKNILPMADLAAMFTRAGCADVKTYIQSGNVVFRADPELAATIPASIAEAIAARFGFHSPVILRDAGELQAVRLHNPFLAAGDDPERLHVGFLADEPDAAAVASLDPQRSPPDRFVVRGRDVYLHFPDGVGRSKLTSAYFDTRLSTTITLRNWRTVLALAAMTGA